MKQDITKTDIPLVGLRWILCVTYNVSGQRPRATGFPIATVVSSRVSLQSDGWPQSHSLDFSLSGSYQYSNPLRLRTPREPRKTKRAVNRARVKKECARILRPEVTTV